MLNRSDVEEAALLEYVFGLEALLTGDAKDAISEKIVTAAALLIGQNHDECDQIHRIAKKAYDMRSRMVHGSEPGGPVAPVLPRIRAVLQRALVVTVSLTAEGCTEADYRKILRALPLSSEVRAQVAQARAKSFELIADKAPIELPAKNRTGLYSSVLRLEGRST